MKEAFAGESQANRKYLAFAAKADEEGFPQVARLFRAAAEAETESKENLSWEIRKNNIQKRISEGNDESQGTFRKEEVMAEKKALKKTTKKVVKKGDVYQCSVCGLAVTVDEVCGCVDACDIVCCEKQMKPKKRA